MPEFQEPYCLNRELFVEAKKYIPSGVNSPVRAFRGLGCPPRFIKKGKGAYFWDEQGKKYIDFCLSWGALILGHAYPDVIDAIKRAADRGTSFGAPTKEQTQLAQLLVKSVPSIERVRLVNSGTEAVMTALRLARAFTGRKKLVKFTGAYHGYCDSMLSRAGSGMASLGIASSPGILPSCVKETITIPFNDRPALERVFSVHGEALAAVIVEPVAANCGVVLPEPGYLEFLRKLTLRFGALLIFDEVITGFRLARGGAQGYFGVRPDLTCLGKIAGGGMPLAAVGGRAKIMNLLAPEGRVYQAGTLSGNPLAVAAAITAITLLNKKNPYLELASRTAAFCEEIKRCAASKGVKISVRYIASMFSISFTDNKSCGSDGISGPAFRRFAGFYRRLLDEGVYFSPSPLEANFVSLAHTEKDLARALEAVKKAFG